MNERQAMFIRRHHQRIAQVLLTLDGAALLQHQCLFGGGTAIALRYGEYRESVDMNFLVADISSYRQLRLLTTGPDGIAALFKYPSSLITQTQEVRADQYGIRTMLQVDGQQVKFEIILEGRMRLQPGSAEASICGVATLSPLDTVASKLLANSDRWVDSGVFNRDLIDLAMIQPSRDLLCQAIAKAEQAYGQAIVRDLGKAIDKCRQPGWLDRCMRAMEIDVPKAVLWKNIRQLRRVVTRLSAAE